MDESKIEGGNDMTIKEIISGLIDLKSDDESHREADGTIADVFQNDIDVLDAAVGILTSLQTVERRSENE